MCASRTWIWEACEKPASCLWVDWVAMMPGSFSVSSRPIEKWSFSSGWKAPKPAQASSKWMYSQRWPILSTHLARVVDGAVVGALLDDGDPDRALAPGRVAALQQRVGGDLGADRLLVERRPVDGPHHPEAVAVRLEIDRDRARDHQRSLVVRLVVVAVEQDDVAVAQQGGVDRLVRARGAVEHEVGPVGSEDPGGLLLRLQRGALADQQVPQRHHGVADVVAEDILAHVVEEEPPHRVAPEHLAALVPWTGPGAIPVVVVLEQLSEERREQAAHVLFDRGEQRPLVEVPRFETRHQHALHLAQVVGVEDLGAALAGQEHRHLEAALAARGEDALGLVSADHDRAQVCAVVDRLAGSSRLDAFDPKAQRLLDRLRDRSLGLAHDQHAEVALDRDLHRPPPPRRESTLDRARRPSPLEPAAVGRSRPAPPAGAGSATTSPPARRLRRWFPSRRRMPRWRSA